MVQCRAESHLAGRIRAAASIVLAWLPTSIFALENPGSDVSVIPLKPVIFALLFRLLLSMTSNSLPACLHGHRDDQRIFQRPAKKPFLRHLLTSRTRHSLS